MEDPSSWQHPSQSFGYGLPQTTMAPKNPFAVNTTEHTSPSKSAAYRLRWHNFGAEDYSPVDGNGASLKRNASMAMLETNLHYPDQLVTDNSSNTTPTSANSQTKRRKASTSTSISSSPIKSKQAVDSILAATQDANQPAKKRRGRPPKNPPTNTNTSKIEFVHETGVNAGTESQGPVANIPPPKSHSSPALQPLDTFVTYPNLHGVNMESLTDADLHANKYWDASFAGSILSDSHHLAASFATMAGEVDLAAATATFDWSVLPTSMGDTTAQSVMDPLRPLAMHSLGESFFHDTTHPDTFNFSFAQDPLSANDIITPVSVNPNLIFAGENLDQSFGGDIEGFRPYHQQNLQQQQDQLTGQRKRQSKAVPPKGQTQTASKAANFTGASKPVLKRALTESALIKSVGKSKSSNATVRPSPAKQMGSFSGKVRPTIRDENTTPSPTVDTMSVRQLSPRSSGTKHSARKVKTAVSFSISPGGRAKAEQVVVRDSDSRSGSDDDQAEYDSDSSTDEDDPLSNYSMAAQRLAGSKGRHHGSSSLSRSMERPKLARFKTAPANSFSSSSQFLISGDFTSDSFSLGNNPFLPPNLSMSSFSKSPRRRSSKSRGSRHHSRNSSFYSVKSSAAASHATNLGSMREEDEYSEAETVVDEPTGASQGDAILALKQAVARRNSYCAPGTFNNIPHPSNIGSVLDYEFANICSSVGSFRPPSSYGTSRPSTRHTNLLPSSPPMQPYGFSTPQTVRSGYSSDTFNISPTTVTDPDCVTPTTYGARHDFSMDIRCRCSSTGSPEMPVLQW
ncbi:hypothetical protein ABW20_dc0104587 [Dactylellina cionopaga]|nr:hypothetical protein ABW20_dc0104587 [Dactylellina cionopaga]